MRHNPVLLRPMSIVIPDPKTSVIRNLVIALTLFATLLATLPARALEPIPVPIDVEALDITNSVDLHREAGTRLQVSTAPGADGIVRRIEVPSRDGTNTNWAVFALANTSDEQIDRLIVAPNYKLVGSDLFWPDLGSSRILAITPSQGIAPERQKSLEADVFLVTLDPGSIVTFVAEMTTPNLPEIRIWEPDVYEETVNAYTLYRGIILGISGLLALFLTILFVVKGTVMFPATAALAWSVLAYLCIDFGFWGMVFNLEGGGSSLRVPAPRSCSRPA